MELSGYKMVNLVWEFVLENRIIILLVLFLIFALFNQYNLKRAAHLLVAFMSFFMGKRAKHTFKIFFFLKPPIIEIEDAKEFLKKSPISLSIVKYREISETLDTGDLIFFVGPNHEAINVLAKWASTCPFSHVGLIVKREAELWLFETNTTTTEIVPLEARIANYETEIVVLRKLNVKRTEEMRNSLDKFIEEVLGTGHDKETFVGKKELFRAALDFTYPFTNKEIFINHKRLRGLFCSETIAEGYMQMGILPHDDEDEFPDSNEFLPGDFSRFGINKEDREKVMLKNLLLDAFLEDEIMIEKNGKFEIAK